MLDSASAGLRPVRLGSLDVTLTPGTDGALYVRSPQALEPFPDRLTDSLHHWAERSPDTTFVARRVGGNGEWRRVSYAQALAAVRAIGQGLLNLGLSVERPVMILSGNSIEHLLLGLGAMYVGIAHAPISPAYALISQDFAKLRHIHSVLTPGLVFADEGARFAKAIQAVVPPETPVVTVSPGARADESLFETLLATPVTADVDAAHAAIGPDTIAKFLFTSGSTGSPKGVINTERMLCSNQRMLNTVLAFLRDEPPVLVDWLPWNHTFGGNHNVGIVLFNGGTLYIDDGKPVPGGLEQTVRNLREISPTLYFNVPKGFEDLLPYFRAEPELRQRFFARLNLLFYAGAGMGQHVWDALDDLARETIGYKVLMLTGLGATESAPFALCCDARTTRSGNVGLPVPGVELKLAPCEGKLEACLRGPSITPGYWREATATAKAYDAEGFYHMGDALKFADPDDASAGFLFDGRVSEDFKLSSGTWVSVGPLRARMISHFAPYAKDVVIAGHNRDVVAAFIIPELAELRRLCPELGAAAAPADIVAHPAARQAFADRLSSFAASATGSSTRVVRLIVMFEPLQIDAHEVTDKGSINQRAFLAHRAALVDDLYAPTPSDRVIKAG
jgi:feruloyl-CoA synthase